MLDYHMILDLIPALSRAFFLKQLPRPISENNENVPAESMGLSPVQSAILFAIGLQLRPIEDLQSELKLPASQVLAMFIKIVRKFALLFRATRLSEIAADEEVSGTLIRSDIKEIKISSDFQQSLEEDLTEGGNRAISALKEQQRAMIDSLPLEQFAIKSPESSSPAWSEELARKSSKLADTVISVPRPSKSFNDEKSKKGSAVKELYEKYVATESKN